MATGIGSDAHPNNSATDKSLKKGSSVTDGNDNDSQLTDFPLTVDVNVTAKQVTLDTGTGRGDIMFLGTLDIADELKFAGDSRFTDGQPTNGMDDQGSSPATDYVALRLGAGTGKISFREGIAKNVQLDDQDPQNPTVCMGCAIPFGNRLGEGGGGRNTVDLIVESGTAIDFGAASFVNSFDNKAGALVTGGFTRIFHTTVLAEIEDGSQPPIFPEPQLPGRFGPTPGGAVVGIPPGPGPAPGPGPGQILAIASAVEETQREDDAACEEGIGAGGKEGGAREDCASPTGGDVADLYVVASGSR